MSVSPTRLIKVAVSPVISGTLFRLPSTLLINTTRGKTKAIPDGCLTDKIARGRNSNRRYDFTLQHNFLTYRTQWSLNAL